MSAAAVSVGRRRRPLTPRYLPWPAWKARTLGYLADAAGLEAGPAPASSLWPLYKQAVPPALAAYQLASRGW